MGDGRQRRDIGVRALACAAAVVVAALVLAGCASSGGSQVVEEGREVYAANCAACHGANAEGQPDWHVKKADGTLPAPPLNGDGHTWHHADGVLYWVVSEGGQILEDPALDFKSAMPAFGGQLSQSEIVAVLTYVKSLWGGQDEPGAVDPGVAGAGQRAGPVSGGVGGSVKPLSRMASH